MNCRQERNLRAVSRSRISILALSSHVWLVSLPSVLGIFPLFKPRRAES